MNLASSDFYVMVIHYDVPAEISDKGCHSCAKVSTYDGSCFYPCLYVCACMLSVLLDVRRI